MYNCDQIFEFLCSKPSDINEHLPTLKKYASECETIVELGVRSVVSTWAFVSARPKKIISVDIVHPSHYGSSLDAVYLCCFNEKIDFNFIASDSRKVTLPEHDLLFIDTLHNYSVLKEELKWNAQKTKKYIIFHDTVTFGDKDEQGIGFGLNKAINEFLLENPNWNIKEKFENNNGLTVLKNDRK